MSIAFPSFQLFPFFLFTFSIKSDILYKSILRRCSQAPRHGSCKTLIPVFNSGHRLHKNKAPDIFESFFYCLAIQSFGIGPYLFFLFCPGKKASRMTAAMNITATSLVAVSWLPRYSPPS